MPWGLLRFGCQSNASDSVACPDLREAVALARQHSIITIADNTLMTPYLQRPLEAGVDIVVHSATKYLSGHSDCLAGVVVTGSPRLAEEIRFLQNCIGAVLAPHECWLIMRGIKTLKVRLEQQQATAGRIAGWLKTRPEVRAVYYPGLEDHPGRDLHLAQAGGGGGVLSFRLSDGESARRLINGLRLPVIGSSLGAVESIVTLPTTMSHGALTEELRGTLGITSDLVRLSVGLEDFDDLRDDLAAALQNQ
jgi:cystathionine beta-lyase